MFKRLTLGAGALMFALPLAISAHAAGGGGGGTAQNCPQGQVWNQAQQKCVPPEKSMLDDESIYQAGRDLAHAGRYDEAIRVLSLAADKKDARILNYLGFSHRMQGRVLVGLGYYQEALINDPANTLVREYMGEAYLMLGDVAAARGQLEAIERLCGSNCEEYAMLAEQIEKHLAKGS